MSSVLILPPGPIVDRHRRPQERLQAARRPPAYPNQARIIAPVTPSHPSAVLTPSTCMNRWIRVKYKVALNESERTHLKQIASRGEISARKVKRALVLLKADEGLTDSDIAGGLLISASTVGRVRTRFVKGGLDSALNERPRPGQKRKLDGRQEAHLIAIACSDAPEGHADWTIQLLADKVVAMGFAESISLETVRQILKKTNSSRGRRRSGAYRK